VEKNFPPGRLQVSSDEIEDGRFASAVGANDTGHLALGDREIHILHRHKPVEGFGYFLDPEQHGVTSYCAPGAVSKAAP
jgi:hypothetical protein